MKKKLLWTSIFVCISGLTTQAFAENKNTNSSSFQSQNKFQSQASATSKTASTSSASSIAATVSKAASSQPIVSQEKHLWNLQDVEIIKVVAEVSRETGKNFILDPQVTGKVTIISSEPIGSDEVYSIFLSTLQVLGYGTVDNGDLIKIIPLKDAVQNGVIAKKGVPKTGDTLIVKVVSLKNVSAVQLSPSLTPLVPSWANITAYAPSNSIIISGTANIVKRIEAIIDNVDTPFANGIDIIPLRYADAAEVVKSIEKLEQGHRFASGDYGSSVSADVRTNSIMLGGSDATRLHYKVLITQLDVPNNKENKDAGTDIQVFNLKFSPITAILPVLRASLRQSVNVNVVDSSNSSGSSSYTSSSSSSSTGGGSSSSPIANKIPEVTNASLNAGAASSSDQSGVTIVGDVPSNSLIITAPPNIMRTIKTIIEKLDVRPKQILVQGIIAQVNADTNNKLGIRWGAEGINLGVGGPFSMGFIRSGSMRSVMTALVQDDNTNILSTPSLTVLNNGNASITIGSSVSVSVGAIGQPSTSVNPNVSASYTYAYKDVGLSLNVVPQITADNSVNMKITQANSSIIPKTTSDSGSSGLNQNTNPDINNQSLSTSVLVKNEDILVLGGLTQNQQEVHIVKIPFISSIPLLGRLFKYEEKRMVKKDLLIFLRPIILSDSNDAATVSQNKYEMMRNTELDGLKSTNWKSFRHVSGTSVLPEPTHQALPEPFSQGA